MTEAKSPRDDLVPSQSVNPVVENVDRLAAMFPEAITDGNVDFEVLRELLGDGIEAADERYGLVWNGKRQALRFALSPSTGTLRPHREDSADWDTTENLMIEGDNLEVLKIAQKSYAGKVKVIYIDPPYNTGKDFVYKDNYRDNIANYLEQTGQVDEEGNKTSTNTEASGRFHTDWLNMMYPRLKLAHSLLRDDGVLFVSLDDAEAGNLRIVLDDIFGASNFIATFIWRKKYTLSFRDEFVIPIHEYVLCYCKNRKSGLELSDPWWDGADTVGVRPVFKSQNPRSRKVFRKGARLRGPASFTIAEGSHALPSQTLEFHDAAVFEDGELVDDVEVTANYGVGQDTLDASEIEFSESGAAYVVDSPDGEEATAIRPISVLLDYTKDNKDFVYEQYRNRKAVSTRQATSQLEELLSRGAFSHPKPEALIRKLLSFVTTNDDDIVLDFFAGSGTSGHAVMAQNAEDGGSRRFILVQLPEPLDPEVKEQKAAAKFCDEIDKPRNLAELTKERLRRAAKKIAEENPDYDGDLGFRAFKLDSSNIREWDENPEDLEESLLAAENHVKEDRTDEDLLYELLLKQGIDLSERIETKEIAGHNVQSIGAGTLITCLDQTITQEDTQALGEGIAQWHKELDPAGETTCIFRDSAFPNDVAKTNLTETLNQNNINTIRSI